MEETSQLAEKLGNLLKERKMSVATAESCTGGGIAAALTDIAGSSEWFMGGFVTYANEWKMRRLGVLQKTLESFGAVSQETVSEMLTGLLQVGETEYGIAVSGIAGPGGGTAEKPVGTVYIGVADKNGQDIRRYQFEGDRSAVRQATVNTAIQQLLSYMKG